jgi:hypothetical protein
MQIENTDTYHLYVQVVDVALEIRTCYLFKKTNDKYFRAPTAEPNLHSQQEHKKSFPLLLFVWVVRPNK